MNFYQQGTASPGYTVVPRTLVFVTCGDKLLLLRGAPDKRLWPNRLNGVGGHLNPDEDPWQGARREVFEETGLAVDQLDLRATIHISGAADRPGVLLFVFLAEAPSLETLDSPEGRLAWFPLQALPWDDLVPDLPLLLPRLLGSSTFIYGTYTHNSQGNMSHRFYTGARHIKPPEPEVMV